MSGIFAQWQPLYAEAGIATFPVREKRPAVKGYLRLGARASEQFALKFSNDNAFGFACKRSRITVLDVDTPDERVLADALAVHGHTPVIVRSGSGNWQAWYRRDGEIRRVRPDPGLPIDILGDGFVVAPPSLGSRGAYQFIQGGLNDIADLPKRTGPPYTDSVYNRLTPSSASPALPLSAPLSDEIGKRNDTLFREAMRLARQCGTIEQLGEMAMRVNATFAPPLGPDEVWKVVTSAWQYQIADQNWVGGESRATVTRAEILAFPASAMTLLLLLRASHSHRNGPFAISQNEVAQLLGTQQPRMPGLIRELTEMGLLRRVHQGKGKGDPHQYILIDTRLSA